MLKIKTQSCHLWFCDEPSYSRQYASSNWYDIRIDRTLTKLDQADKEEPDEKHMHPLQLDVIERACVLWSNPGETVFTPFMGIGSEVYGAVSIGRRGVGIELKPAYFKQAKANLAGVAVNNKAEDCQVERLRADLSRVSRERDELRRENLRLRQRVNQTDAPVAMLRKTLEPLYHSLQGLFGEIEVIQPEATMPANGAAPAQAAGSSPVWDLWKSKLGSTVAKGITALQQHGELDSQQLAIAAGLDKRTVTNTVVYKLNQAGLINKNNGRFSLKAI